MSISIIHHPLVSPIPLRRNPAWQWILTSSTIIDGRIHAQWELMQEGLPSPYQVYFVDGIPRAEGPGALSEIMKISFRDEVTYHERTRLNIPI